MSAFDTALDDQSPSSPTTLNKNVCVGLLKLNVDCFEELFEWISVAELLQLRASCKRLQQVVDYYIRENFPLMKFGVLDVSDDKFVEFCRLDVNSTKVLKEVRFFVEPISDIKIEEMKETLKHLERITIRYNLIEADFYENFLKFCTNLKSLTLLYVYGNVLVGSNNEWMLRRYPTLEHVYFEDTDISGDGFSAKINELRTFFELNPNIQSLKTSSHFLEENGDCFLGANIKLDKLIIHCDCFLEYGMNRLCELLKKLYQQGFYKRLHFYGSFIYEKEDLNNIFAVPGIEKLCLRDVDSKDVGLIQPQIPELKELSFSYSSKLTDLETVVKNLLNIERIRIYEIRSDDLALFIQYATKVKHIKIESLEGESFFDMLVDQLPKFNAERKKLRSASKITIYVDEDLYLSLKFADVQINLEFIQIKRKQAYIWEKAF